LSRRTAAPFSSRRYAHSERMRRRRRDSPATPG
jgi:hypothetical protein